MAFVPPSPTAASEHALQADPWEVPMITTQPSGQHARDGIDDTVLARQRQQIEALQRQLEQSQQAIRQLQLAMQPNALHDTTRAQHTATARSSLSRHSVPREPNAPFYSDSFYLYAAPYGPWLVNLTDENDAKVLERDDCIPRFAGEVHEDAFQWLQTFDDMAHANQWYSWDARVRMLPKYLESAALRWWHENRVYFQGWHNVEEDPMSISYFRGAFLTQFVQPALFIRWSQELHNAQQECGESATSYCTRIRQLVSRVCIQEELSETTIARRMLLGVMPKIAEAIVAHKRINGSWTITDVEAEIRRKARDLIQIYGKDVTTRPDGPIGASEPTDSQGHVLRNASRFIASLMPNRKTTRRPAPTRSNTSQSSRGSRSGNVSRRRNDARSKDDMSQLTKPMQKAILVLSNGRQLHVYENGTPVNACRRCGGHGHWQRDCTFDTDARKRNGLSLPPASQTTSSSDATVAPLSSTTGTSPIARPPRRVTRSATGLPDNARPSVVNKDSTVSARTTTKMSN
ncbi:hypothetical protein THASP1DRAFT_23327 [Thamnocephalis sphaerospora]|uniref:CCHC-type domain-containing protein n=1 Tax=Thamnocephalis sphaerospora TaxID=78915 RepID=A0A4P9XRN2_9FUNG|nr:hypothetical protein THASP1DRAFT_23327 [Thamnocephalis sphaerospora]|eukprot:RKP08728.1 hypothetical protein THASP1DRAFT_23327 [Thamnocephalis sphaerospora]